MICVICVGRAGVTHTRCAIPLFHSKGQQWKAGSDDGQMCDVTHTNTHTLRSESGLR